MKSAYLKWIGFALVGTGGAGLMFVAGVLLSVGAELGTSAAQLLGFIGAGALAIMGLGGWLLRRAGIGILAWYTGSSTPGKSAVETSPNPRSYASFAPEDNVDEVAVRAISRLISEEKRHLLLAAGNLLFALLLVFVTVIMIGSLFQAISVGTFEGEGTDLISDCEASFSSPNSIAAVTLPEGQEAEFWAKRIAAKNQCIKSVLPTMEAMDKYRRSTGNAGSPDASWSSMSITDIYSIVSRFLLVLLLQTLTFFFLRLYVGNTSDARYFANEVTNLEARLLAYKITKAGDASSLREAIVAALMATDRNIALERGRRPLFGSRDPHLKDLTTVLQETAQLIRQRTSP